MILAAEAQIVDIAFAVARKILLMKLTKIQWLYYLLLKQLWKKSVIKKKLLSELVWMILMCDVSEDGFANDDWPGACFENNH